MTLKESERLQLTDWMHDALALLVQRGAELTHGEMRIRFGLEAVLRGLHAPPWRPARLDARALDVKDEGGATRRAELGHIVRMLDAALALFRRTVVPPPTEEGRVQLLLRATRRCTGEEIAAQGLAPGAPGRLAG